MALSAAAVYKRIKAVVASTMYDMTQEQRTQMLEQLSLQRWKDAGAGQAHLPAALQRAKYVLLLRVYAHHGFTK